ncbi:AbgT family transporter [Streptomyces sp. NBC_01373]|uniref:AbgT family transporter n=1 Tax=Streptomyces sp. NBC_01373 TaxID=2903843 RepID=UPI00225A1895|nr:AbgT family transporter [Streptomyces sp. NBC_01373]MCX4706425.1 AbgT family transporter [Streptomyces sp. NBC_01373]
MTTPAQRPQEVQAPEPDEGGRGSRLLDLVERAGNALPHPFWLFWILCGVVALVSSALNASGLRVEDPSSGDLVGVRSALSADAVRDLITGAEESFVTFGPLGTVLMVMLGVAVAERSGLFEALARRMLSGLSPRTVVLGVALGGVLGKFLSDSAYVVLIPLGAVAFRAVGRSPMLGMIVAFVSINAAGDANPLIAPGDALFASVATEAAQLVDKGVVVRATDNMYFTTVSAFVLAGTIALVVDKILAKREHHLTPDADLEAAAAQRVVAAEVDDATEVRALKLTGLAVLGYATLIVLAMLPASSPLRGERGAIVESTFMNAIAVFLTVFFLLIGAVYGRLTGRIRGSRAIPEFMAEGVRSIAPLLVLFFAVSQFLALFKWTNIATVVAVEGADFLKQLGAPTLVLFSLLIVAVALMNLLITSGSALWTLVAPALVPMLMLLGTSPATTMALYRIADSCTNSITPMSTSFMLCVGYLQTLRRKAGIGTLVSFTLPLAMIMLVIWVLLFFAWYLLGIPLGPGAPVR